MRVPKHAGSGTAKITLSFPELISDEIRPVTLTATVEEPPDVAALIREFKQRGIYGSQQVSATMIAEYGEYADAAVSEIANFLNNKDPYVRMKIVDTLGRMSGVEDVVVPKLIVALQDETSYVRRHAADALVNIGPSATKALHGICESKETDAGLRKRIEELLRRIESE